MDVARTSFALLLAALISSGCLLGGDDDDADSSENDDPEDGGASPTATAEPTEYVVQAGDTLSGIAEQFDVPLGELQQVNGIANANQLQVGQTLIIPSGDIPVATATAAESSAEGGEVTATATATSAASAGCDASYPDVCIPPAPPLLSCEDITPRGFRVVDPDPHNLDQDNNGFGCDE
jgi:LysM repeat protein